MDLLPRLPGVTSGRSEDVLHQVWIDHCSSTETDLALWPFTRSVCVPFGGLPCVSPVWTCEWPVILTVDSSACADAPVSTPIACCAWLFRAGLGRNIPSDPKFNDRAHFLSADPGPVEL